MATEIFTMRRGLPQSQGGALFDTSDRELGGPEMEASQAAMGQAPPAISLANERLMQIAQARQAEAQKPKRYQFARTKDGGLIRRNQSGMWSLVTSPEELAERGDFVAAGQLQHTIAKSELAKLPVNDRLAMGRHWDDGTLADADLGAQAYTQQALEQSGGFSLSDADVEAMPTMRGGVGKRLYSFEDALATDDPKAILDLAKRTSDATKKKTLYALYEDRRKEAMTLQAKTAKTSASASSDLQKAQDEFEKASIKYEAAKTKWEIPETGEWPDTDVNKRDAELMILREDKKRAQRKVNSLRGQLEPDQANQDIAGDMPVDPALVTLEQLEGLLKKRGIL